MICKKCKHNISLREVDKYITLLCKCEIIIIYETKNISRISKKNYKPNYRKKRDDKDW